MKFFVRDQKPKPPTVMDLAVLEITNIRNLLQNPDAVHTLENDTISASVVILPSTVYDTMSLIGIPYRTIQILANAKLYNTILEQIRETQHDQVRYRAFTKQMAHKMQREYYEQLNVLKGFIINTPIERI